MQLTNINDFFLKQKHTFLLMLQNYYKNNYRFGCISKNVLTTLLVKILE